MKESTHTTFLSECQRARPTVPAKAGTWRSGLAIRASPADEMLLALILQRLDGPILQNG